ncbi:hypothetical protein A9Q99_15610 [Gammaproteobacteria bacterium 45_16_T64]|nr:hypothetical protein A9Q99_15610 [Gammaproteobacteria bacterium 45_16_T64]
MANNTRIVGLLTLSGMLLACGPTVTPFLWQSSVIEEERTFNTLIDTGNGQISHFVSDSSGNNRIDSVDWQGNSTDTYPIEHRQAVNELVSLNNGNYLAISNSQGNITTISLLSSSLSTLWEVDLSSNNANERYRQFTLDAQHNYIAISGIREPTNTNSTELDEEFIELRQLDTGNLIKEQVIDSQLDIKDIAITAQGTVYYSVDTEQEDMEAISFFTSDSEYSNYFGTYYEIESIAVLNEDIVFTSHIKIGELSFDVLGGIPVFSGGLSWMKTFSTNRYGHSLHVRGDNIFFLGKSALNSVNISNLDAQGNTQWSQKFATSGTPQQLSIRFDNNNNSLVSYLDSTLFLTPNDEGLYEYTENLIHQQISHDGDLIRKIVQETYTEKNIQLIGPTISTIAGPTKHLGMLINTNNEIVLLSDIEGEDIENEYALTLY